MSDPIDESTLMSHEADGIKELDNNLPRWWLWLFYITIIFSIPYIWYFHLSSRGDSSQVRFERAAYEAHLARRARAVSASARGALFAAPSIDPEILARGRGIYLVNCAACHLESGAGQIGPNLTDNHFIHGPTYADVVRIVQNGVVEKGMIAWKNQLRPDDIQAVCSYVHSLRGSNPPNPKAPEGQEYPL